MKADEPRQNRIPFMMSDAELAALDEWRHTHRIGTRAEAIRRLCQLAITLEPLTIDNRVIWMDAQNAATAVSAAVLDAWANIDTKSDEENLRPIDDGVSKLSQSMLEFMVHANLMVDILDAVVAGETVESSLEDMKERIRVSAGTRQFVRDHWGDKK